MSFTRHVGLASSFPTRQTTLGTPGPGNYHENGSGRDEVKCSYQNGGWTIVRSSLSGL